MKFKNKIVLITGSSRGIGAVTAQLFAKEGATVIINYKNNKTAADSTVNEIIKNGGDAIAIKADVGNINEINLMFKTIADKYSKLDVLVNNAGVLINKPFLERTVNDWNKTFSINTTGVFLCTQSAAKIMLKQKSGSIINIASIRGLSECGVPDRIDYSASKAAVISMTKTLAKELAPNIRVNAVAPGKADTEMANYSRETIPDIIKTIHLNRLIEPKEIAKAILFLASEESSAITGNILMVDGGQSLN